MSQVTNTRFWRRSGSSGVLRRTGLGPRGTKAWIIRSRRQTRRWCLSKPDPSDLLRSSRWCPVITRLEACSRSTSHHLDSPDLPGHGKTGDRCSGAGKRQIVLATNRNGGMLRLNATRHDDDDDDDDDPDNDPVSWSLSWSVSRNFLKHSLFTIAILIDNLQPRITWKFSAEVWTLWVLSSYYYYFLIFF